MLWLRFKEKSKNNEKGENMALIFISHASADNAKVQQVTGLDATIVVKGIRL